MHGATWQEAEDTCREIDAHLVLSRSDTENEFIAVEVGRPESRVWIGLRRKQGEFIWSDGQKAEYTNWGPREPKDSSVSGRDCVSLLPEDIFYSWEVTKCDSLQAFICERGKRTKLFVTVEPRFTDTSLLKGLFLWFQQLLLCSSILSLNDTLNRHEHPNNKGASCGPGCVYTGLENFSATFEKGSVNSTF